MLLTLLSHQAWQSCWPGPAAAARPPALATLGMYKLGHAAKVAHTHFQSTKVGPQPPKQLKTTVGVQPMHAFKYSCYITLHLAVTTLVHKQNIYNCHGSLQPTSILVSNTKP